ncbi:MAG TPA: DNA topoisomerase I [Candidatus Bathyarchaeia archaeon]|nr:DNA topoisomerase I [Candidatus Bathyarchaeia archaeon]
MPSYKTVLHCEHDTRWGISPLTSSNNRYPNTKQKNLYKSTCAESSFVQANHNNVIAVDKERERPRTMEKYTLIVTEKPDAAQRIAQALDRNGKPKRAEEKTVPYYMAQRDRPLVIVPALGHLYTVVQASGKRNTYPVFNFLWAPRHMAEKNAERIKNWIEVITQLAEDADSFIDACDYDIEGSLIGYTILKHACHDKDNAATRMKYSTLTNEELEKSYADQMPHLDFAMIEAGRTRHEVDWLYGINLSRALTIAANRASGGYTTLSTGRVQGPTLRFLVARERSINSFVPTPYRSINAQVEIQGASYLVDYEQRTLEKKADADAVVEACSGKNGIVEKIEEKTVQIPPPIPFDLGSLQSEAYSFFGYTPRRTGQIAERLYLEALISYPRTSSQKLPPAINYKNILNGLSQELSYKSLASELLGKDELKPREGTKEDPAHPAVYPTGNKPTRALEETERRLWDLVIRRFLAVFGEAGIKQSMKAAISVNGHHFFLRGRQILKQGWMKFYKPYLRSEEVLLPPIKEGETVKFMKIAREDKFTMPPPRYNPSSLLKRMEKEGIGTKATRADIIETLYNRKYTVGERIAVTDLGFDVTAVLRTHASQVISVKLTRDLEEKMERIQQNLEKRENVLQEAIDRLKPVLATMKQQEAAIGQALTEAVKKARLQERVVGACPNCQTGKLMIIFSRRTGKRFIGCTNYFQSICKTSFPLPQRGIVKPTGKTCKTCGWPILFVRMPGKRPWTLCINPTCPKKEERRKRLEMQGLQSRSSS